MNEKQLNFLKKLEYLSKEEIKDLLKGYTTVEVLLDSDDLLKFDELGE